MAGVALAILTVSGCTAGSRTPTSLGDDRPGVIGRSGGQHPVVGQWKNIWVVVLTTDVQTWTTVWTFGADGTCHLEKTFRSIAFVTPETTDRDCRFGIEQNDLVITYDDNGTIQRLPFSFAASSRDRLVLEGLEYERLA